MKSFFNEMVNFSLESSGPTKFWILPKLYEFCKYCCKNAATISFNIDRLNSGENPPLQTSFIKLDFAIATFTNLLNMAVLEEPLNKMEIDHVG